MGCAFDAQRCIQGYWRDYMLLGILAAVWWRNCGTDMALEAYCGQDVVTTSWKTVNMLMLIDDI